MTHCVKCGDDLHESQNVLCETCYTRAITQAEPLDTWQVVVILGAMVAAGVLFLTLLKNA